MKYAKTIGLATVALAALLVMSSTASATILTSPSGTTYTSTIKAEAAGTVSITSIFGGFGSIECTESAFEGKVETHGTGVTVGGKITHLTFGGCMGGEPTTATSTSGAGSLQIHSVSPTGNGTVTWFNSKLVVDNTVFGRCSFTTASTGTHIGTLTGSSNTSVGALLHIDDAKLGSPCGTGTWEAKYKIVTPSFLDVH
jgi:hypothetical protein